MIFCDMDGVLTDFAGRCNELLDFDLFEEQEKHGMDCIWEPINKFGLDFWTGMPWVEGGKKLWDFVGTLPDVRILSAIPDPTLCPYALEGKEIWIKDNLGNHVDYTITRRSNKVDHCLPYRILIDDFPKTVKEWRDAGGLAILHNAKSVDFTLETLKDYLGI